MSIEELEVLRKKARNIVLIGIFCSILIAVLLFCITKIFITLVIGIIVGIIITRVVSSKSSKKFILAFKESFVLKALKSVFTDLNYEPENGIDESVIGETKMMNMGDRYSSNDYISAKYKNINVEQADVHIEEEQQSTDSDGNTTTSWVTIFRGRWMIFDFNKNFKANIQVSQRGFHPTAWGN